MKSLLARILKEECPYCGNARIFKPGRHLPFQTPAMFPQCPSCKKDLEPEPGYFLGAMYVSYALAVGEGIVTFLLLKLLTDIDSLWWIIGIIWIVIILFSNKNLRWSRIIWLAIFSSRNYR